MPVPQNVSPFPAGSPNNPNPVNASMQPKGTVFGAPMKSNNTAHIHQSVKGNYKGKIKAK